MHTQTDEQGHLFYTGETTDDDILLAFSSDTEWLTRKQICDRIWRSKNPGAIAKIEHLVGEGFLERVTDDTRLKAFWYRRTGKYADPRTLEAVKQGLEGAQ